MSIAENDHRAVPAISLENVCCGYDGREVLHNVSFVVPARSLTCVVGPNGGGKTTLLSLVLGLIRPFHGTVRVFGTEPNAARRLMAYVPQSFNFDPSYPVSVWEVTLSGRAGRSRLGFYNRDDRAATMSALERVGLAQESATPFAQLSGGQRQRVLVAQALAQEPEILLLDEPTANVDERAARELHDLFAELAINKTVMMVSHNLSLIAAKATHIVCVNRTATLHTTAELPQSHLAHSIYGEEYMVLQHDSSCHVLNESGAATPHDGYCDI